MTSPRKRAPHSPAITAAPVETEVLFKRVVTILEEARDRAVRAVNSQMVLAYWHIGREIVQSVQGGEQRAEYGEAVLEKLSEALNRRFGRGFSVAHLRYLRLFYLTYADRQPEIHHEARDESRVLPAPIHHEGGDVSADLARAAGLANAPRGFSPSLSWTHYRVLTKVENAAERLFYELEAERDGWSTPVLERQIHTQLFARLRKSRDKAGVLDLATRGIALQRPIDTIRDPYVLDFLDLPWATGPSDDEESLSRSGSGRVTQHARLAVTCSGVANSACRTGQPRGGALPPPR
jgi:hypothetical protein